MAKVGESFERSGGKFIGAYDCSWSTPKWHMFGMETYPSIEALREHITRQREIGWLQYIEEEEAVVGVPWEEADTR